MYVYVYIYVCSLQYLLFSKELHEINDRAVSFLRDTSHIL